MEKRTIYVEDDDGTQYPADVAKDFVYTDAWGDGFLRAKRASREYQEKQAALTQRAVPPAVNEIMNRMTSQDALEAPGTQSAISAGEGFAIPGVVKKALGDAYTAIPRKARAGGGLEQVLAAAKDVPIDTSKVQSVLDRSSTLASRGNPKPSKPIKDFIKRITDSADPVTYEEGFDFASAAKDVSAKDATRLNAKQLAQSKQFAKAMSEANREAAEKVGLGELYDSAMTEYRRAASMAEKLETIKKWAGRAALTAAGYGALDKLLSRHRGGP